MMSHDGLRRSLGLAQYFSLSFGGIVGVGWIVLLGQWLEAGGPLGAITGFALGGAMMGLIGLCYAEAGSMYPVSGGEMAYGYAAFGPRAGFAVGWALLLMFISATSYICLSMAWIVDVMVPGLQGPVLYTLGGGTVRAGSLVVAAATLAVFTVINLRGIRSAGRFQDVFTYGKIAIALVFLGAGLVGGSTANLTPLFQDAGGRTPAGSILATLAIVPWFFGGFNIIPQTMEERSPETPLRLVGLVTVATILAAAVFYCLAILSASMSMPWRELVALELPAASAFRVAFGSTLLERLVLVTGLFGVATVGNSVLLCATRVLFAMGRAGMAPAWFGSTHPRTGATDHSLAAVVALAGAGLLAGREGIGPIVAVGAACLALAYLATSAAVLRLRRTDSDRPRPYRMPLGALIAPAATLGSLGLVGAALYGPLAAGGGGLPGEWLVLGLWTIAGIVTWRLSARMRAAIPEADRRRQLLGE
jgi:amino acid transporter